jgi:hypothetical protein
VVRRLAVAMAAVALIGCGDDGNATDSTPLNDPTREFAFPQQIACTDGSRSAECGPAATRIYPADAALPANALATCVSSRCMWRCIPNRTNCDSNAANGCETERAACP